MNGYFEENNNWSPALEKRITKELRLEYDISKMTKKACIS